MGSRRGDQPCRNAANTKGPARSLKQRIINKAVVMQKNGYQCDDCRVEGHRLAKLTGEPLLFVTPSPLQPM